MNLLPQTLRVLSRQRLYTAISIIGLAVGLAVCLSITLFLRHEMSFDNYHPGSDRIYRLNWLDNGTGSRFATFFNPVTPLLAQGFEEIEAFSRLALSDRLLEVGSDQQFHTISLIDPGFFELFSFPEIRGDTASIIDRSSAVMTRAAALQIFGREDAVGETFVLDDNFVFQLTAVVENNPANSHLVSNIFINIENLPQLFGMPNFWDNMGSDIMYHYIRLAEGADVESFGERALQYVAETTPIGQDFVAGIQMPLQSLTDVHFTADLQNEMSLRDDITGVVKPLRQPGDVIIFAAVALLTLLIAGFNFANLQIAQATRRTREIAVRRTLGADKGMLFRQFLTESMLLTTIGLVFAVILCAAFLPLFGTMVSAPLSLNDLAEPALILALVAVSLGVALVSGLYPALQSIIIPPALGLRGEVAGGVSGARVRTSLVTLQFAIAAGLIISCGVISQQIDYATSKSLGFAPENVVVVSLPNATSRAAYPVMRDQLLGLSAVTAVSASSIVPTQSLSDGSAFSRAADNNLIPILTRRVSTSEDYFAVLGMEFLAGRALSEDFPTDTMPSIGPDKPAVSGGVVFNETAARLAGWNNPQDAIGAQLFSEFSFGGTDYRMNYTVVGVVNDAHFGSVRTAIAPVSFTLDQTRSNMIIQVRNGSMAIAMAEIDRIWNADLPAMPINRSLLEETYTAFYASENRAFVLFLGFTAIAVLIACLGLYGLATYIIDRRRKEISIRKVLGATVQGLVSMFSWEFSRLVLLANLIAWPIAWWLMQDWLSNFAYRDSFDVLLFAYAAIITLSLALTTTSVKVLHAASSNPVEALRAD